MFIGLNGFVVLLGTVVGLMLCWVSEDGGMVVEECEKNLVLRVYDKIMFYIWSNAHKKHCQGGKRFTFPMVNATIW